MIKSRTQERIARTGAAFGSALLAGATVLCLGFSATFFQAITSSRLLPILVLLLAAQSFICPRWFYCREFALYSVFLAYLFLTLLWTPDGVLGLNTLFPAVDFLLVQIIIGSLFMFHDPRAVAWGCLIGFWSGAAIYTSVAGFPFRYPEDFSYNAVAAVYLFGLVLTCVFGWLTRARMLALVSALLALAHIVATTSIKTNLGIGLGAIVATLCYRAEGVRIIRRNLWPLLVALMAGTFAILSSRAIVARIEAGFDRLLIGISVLQTREDQAGYVGFEERERWMQEGLRGWEHNPLFGHGVEAFRADIGITSHSTPVDLLYNTGLIGFCLFYAVFLSLAWRLLVARKSPLRSLQMFVLAGIVCHLFVTFSGTVFYQGFTGAFIAVAAALLRRYESQTPAAQ